MKKKDSFVNSFRPYDAGRLIIGTASMKMLYLNDEGELDRSKWKASIRVADPNLCMPDKLYDDDEWAVLRSLQIWHIKVISNDILKDL